GHPAYYLATLPRERSDCLRRWISRRRGVRRAEALRLRVSVTPRRRVTVTLRVNVTLAAVAASTCSQATFGDRSPWRILVGVVFDIGGKDDRSFNAAAWNGLRCAETGAWPTGAPCGKAALGIVLRDVEPGAPVNIEPAMRAFAERNYDLIVGVGFAQT